MTSEERAALLTYCLQAVRKRDDTIGDVQSWSERHSPGAVYNYSAYLGYHAFKMMRDIESGMKIAKEETKDK